MPIVLMAAFALVASIFLAPMIIYNYIVNDRSEFNDQAQPSPVAAIVEFLENNSSTAVLTETVDINHIDHSLGSLVVTDDNTTLTVLFDIPSTTMEDREYVVSVTKIVLVSNGNTVDLSRKELGEGTGRIDNCVMNILNHIKKNTSHGSDKLQKITDILKKVS